jgi:hypothetical protein
VCLVEGLYGSCCTCCSHRSSRSGKVTSDIVPVAALTFQGLSWRLNGYGDNIMSPAERGLDLVYLKLHAWFGAGCRFGSATCGIEWCSWCVRLSRPPPQLMHQLRCRLESFNT